MIAFLNRLLSHRFAPLVAFVLIAAAFAVVSQHQLNVVRSTQRTQANLIHSGCIRLNIELADENRSHYEDYDFYLQVYKSNKDSQPLDNALLKKLGVKIPPKLQQDEHTALSRLQGDIRGKTWTPLLNCNAVTSARFHIPQPISFATRVPPKSVLQVPPVPANNPGHEGVKPSTITTPTQDKGTH